MKKKILVTGGCGYIGSHTVVDLTNAGYEVVSFDNFSNALPAMEERIQSLCPEGSFRNYNLDITRQEEFLSLVKNELPISGIIHFAAYKSVGESVKKPVEYFDNNMRGLINVMKAAQDYSIENLVFSSSCTVYGNATDLPVTENTPLLEPESPYGRTKRMGEDMLRDFVKSCPVKVVLLRYFNPAGAHPSGKIGEVIQGVPSYLVPYITQTAIGIRPKLTIFGGDYPTRDGTNIRDFIHVCDIAQAHTLALQYMMSGKNESQLDIFNLGTGNGVTVLEAVESFIRVNNQPFNYEIGPRRPGDVVEIYANNDKAKTVLGWNPSRNLDEMMRSAWVWEQQIKDLLD